MLVKKANLISIVLLVIAILFVYFSSKVEAAPTTYWFNNAVSTSPFDVGNYWLDSGQTDPALSLPNFSTEILHIVAGATFNGDAVFNLTATNAGIVTGNATFYNNSINVYPTGQIMGDATFYGNSIDNGVIHGDAFFFDDSLHEQATAHGDITFNDNSVCSISINYGYATFNDTSTNLGGLETDATFNDSSIAYVYINGNVIFNDNSINSSSINGDATFNDNSENSAGNQIIPLTNVIFNNNSINDGVIHGNAIFNHSSVNSEDVIGSATFVNDLSENNVGATATTKTREYTISTTTTRDFVSDGPWTVVANGAEVNVSGAIYNSVTVFTKLNGGSFIPSFDPPSGTSNIWTQSPAQGPFDVKINSNASQTENRLVNLELRAGANITKMAVSKNSYFENANLIPFAQQMQWNICGNESSCPKGVYTVFIHFFTEYGQPSPVISDSIEYNPVDLELDQNNQTPSEVYIPSKDPIHNQITPIHKLFTNDLRFRNTHVDVKRLQQFLNTHQFPLRINNRGAGSPAKETNYFGPYTRRALQKYQKANGLPVTGVLNSNTRTKINKDIEKD
jgi:hypothetical protein